MSFPVRAITLDLDDTLWPFAPIGARIEQVLQAWMEQHSPVCAARFPVAEMRALRERVVAGNPQLAHDLGALRRLTIERALAESGDDPALGEAAYRIFFAERNRVEFYPDAEDALRRISARVPIAALSNGNADLAAIGIDRHFRFQLGAREHGAAKPDASLFRAACERLGHAPRDVLHVGDDIELDIVGAARAGLRTCWVNRPDDGGLVRAWPHEDPHPDLAFDNLLALADWLDANVTPSTRPVAA